MALARGGILPKLKQWKLDFKQLNAKREKLDAKRKKLDAKVKQLYVEWDQLYAKVKQLCAKMKQLYVEWDQLDIEGEQLDAKGEQLDAEGEQVYAKMNKLYIEWDQLCVEWDQLGVEWDQLDAKWDQLYVEWDQLYVEWDQLVAERDQLDAKWDPLYVEFDQLYVELHQLRAEGDQLDAKWDQLYVEWDQLYVEWDQLGAEGDQLNAKWDQLYVEWDQLCVEWDQLCAEGGRLDAKWDQLDIEWDQLYVERDQLNVEWDQLDAEGKQLDAEGEKLEAERKQLDAERKRRDAERKQLYAEWVQLVAEREQRKADLRQARTLPDFMHNGWIREDIRCQLEQLTARFVHLQPILEHLHPILEQLCPILEELYPLLEQLFAILKQLANWIQLPANQKQLPANRKQLATIWKQLPTIYTQPPTFCTQLPIIYTRLPTNWTQLLIRLVELLVELALLTKCKLKGECKLKVECKQKARCKLKIKGELNVEWELKGEWELKARQKRLVSELNHLLIQFCSKGSCWLLNNLIPINKIISDAGTHLNEKPRGELTLTWGPAHYECSAMELVLTLIKSHGCIVHFDYSNMELTPLLKALAAIQDRTDIKSFSLTDTNWSSTENGDFKAGRQLGPLLKNLVDNSANPTYFKLHQKRIVGRKDKEIGEALAKKVRLEELSLGCGRIPDYFVNYSVEKGTTTSLRKFTLKSSWLCVEEVVKLIKFSPKLYYFELHSMEPYNEGERALRPSSGIEEVAKALWDNKSLKTLILAGCNLTSDALFALAEMLLHNETLTTLDISSSTIESEGWNHMARSLKSTATLENLVLDSRGMSPSTMRNIIAASEENPKGPVLFFPCCIPDNLLRICVEERTRKVKFPCTEKVVELTGVPDLFSVTCISIDANNLSETGMQSVCAYLGQDCSRVKKFEFVGAEESHCMQLADLLLSNTVIEEFSLSMNHVSTRAPQALAQVVEKNTHLWKFSIRMCPDCCHAKMAAFFAEAFARNKTLEVFKCNWIFDTEIDRLFSEPLAPNYALTEFTFYTEHSSESVTQDHPIAQRNKVLQQQALYFVLEECPQRRWARAFSLTYHTPTLRRKLQEKTGKSGEEVQGLIGQKLWYLRENFFRITGIVKERVVCNAAPLGVKQIDQLGPHCLMHIVSFLKVDDVKTSSD